MKDFWPTLKEWLFTPIMHTKHTEITPWSVILVALLFTILFAALSKLGSFMRRKVLPQLRLSDKASKRLTMVAQGIGFFYGAVFILDVSDIDVSAKQIFDQVNAILRAPLIPVGNEPITLWTIIFVSALGLVLLVTTSRLQKWLTNKLTEKKAWDVGTTQSITSIFRYAIVALGFVVILQAAGIDLSTITVIAGGLGLGVGLGLQNVVASFISGIVVMLERPVKVGDRIELAGVFGNVIKIGLRATTIRTNSNIEIIVPNTEFITGNVINWSHSSRDVRLDIPVGVTYSADPREVEKVLLEAAAEHDGVLKTPSPDVIFSGFGDSALNFELRVYTNKYFAQPKVLQSGLNFLIFEKLAKAKIEIPFPQRDLHIRSAYWSKKTPKATESLQDQDEPEAESTP